MIHKSNYQNLLTTIHKNNNLFSRTEKKLALFFQENNPLLIPLNISDIAKTAEVSKASVSRFIRKLGYTDFTEFRYLLQMTPVILNTDYENKQQYFKNSNSNFINRIKTDYTILMERTLELLQQKELTYFVEHLKTAQNIYVAGIGYSGLSAKEMSRKFVQLGFSFKVLDDITLILKYIHIMKATDLFILFSTQLESKYLLQAIKLANMNQIHVILITNFSDSTLNKYANGLFLTVHKTALQNNVVIFPQLSQIFLIDILFNAVIASDFDKYSSIMQTMNEAQQTSQATFSFLLEKDTPS